MKGYCASFYKCFHYINNNYTLSRNDRVSTEAATRGVL